MHRWVMLKGVKAVLERVAHDYEGNLVSAALAYPSRIQGFMTDSILAFTWYGSIPTHIA